MNIVQQNRVKREGVHRNASHAENNIPNVPVVPEAPLYVCPKIPDSENRKQKELFRISGNEDRENTPAKVSCSTLVPLVKLKDITDTDDDHETKLERDKRSTPRKPFRNRLSRCTSSDDTAQGIQWQTTV